MRMAVTVVGALVATTLTVGFASSASAVPVDKPEPISAAIDQSPPVTFIEQPCLLPGDTIELRTAVGGAVGTLIGAIVGLPFFIVGSIPGAILGAIVGVTVGASSYASDTGRAQQQGLC